MKTKDGNILDEIAQSEDDKYKKYNRGKMKVR